jgi:hypothetical protein
MWFFQKSHLGTAYVIHAFRGNRRRKMLASKNVHRYTADYLCTSLYVSARIRPSDIDHAESLPDLRSHLRDAFITFSAYSPPFSFEAPSQYFE